MQHTDWLATMTGGASLRQIARTAGIAYSTLNTQTSRGHLSAEHVIAIAAAYNAHPVRALIATGYLDADAAHAPDIEAALRLASDEQLTDEVLRRLKLIPRHPDYDTPVDELARRRAPTPPTFDASAGDVGSLPMVADSSPDHPEEDCEDYP